MKNTYLWIAFTLLLIFCIVLMLRLSFVSKQIEVLKADKVAQTTTPSTAHQEEEIELAIAMNHIQRHANKLYFAGQNGNWPLAAFYIHELEEAMEEVANGNITDEGINISKLMGAMGLTPLEVLEESVEAKSTEQFNSAYLNLVNNCNACHQSTNHPYLVIQNPKTPALDNQVY